MNSSDEQAGHSNFIVRMFADDHAFWCAAAVILGMVSIAKGLRLPNLWSATLAMVNYHNGFVKRGLFGTLFGHVFHIERYTVFAAVSYTLLGIFFGLLIWLTLRSGAISRPEFGKAIVVFCSSYAVTYLTHLVGYFDILLGICAFSLLAIKSVGVRFVAAIPLCAFALLVHESFLITFIPVILFSFFMDGVQIKNSRDRKNVWVMASILLGLSVSLTVRLAHDRPLTDEQTTRMRADLSRRADYPVRADVFTVFERSSLDNLKSMKRHFRAPDWDLLFVVAVVIFTPVVVVLLWAILGIIRQIYQGKTQMAITLAALGAALSPLLMYVQGWDAERWDTLVSLDTFLVFLIICRAVPHHRLQLPAGFRNAALLVIALSMATGEGLMDDRKINTYPFEQLLHGVTDTLRTGVWILPTR